MRCADSKCKIDRYWKGVKTLPWHEIASLLLRVHFQYCTFVGEWGQFWLRLACYGLIHYSPVWWRWLQRSQNSWWSSCQCRAARRSDCRCPPRVPRGWWRVREAAARPQDERMRSSRWSTREYSTQPRTTSTIRAPKTLSASPTDLHKRERHGFTYPVYMGATYPVWTRIH